MGAVSNDNAHRHHPQIFLPPFPVRVPKFHAIHTAFQRCNAMLSFLRYSSQLGMNDERREHPEQRRKVNLFSRQMHTHFPFFLLHHLSCCVLALDNSVAPGVASVKLSLSLCGVTFLCVACTLSLSKFSGRRRSAGVVGPPTPKSLRGTVTSGLFVTPLLISRSPGVHPSAAASTDSSPMGQTQRITRHNVVPVATAHLNFGSTLVREGASCNSSRHFFTVLEAVKYGSVHALYFSSPVIQCT